MESLEIMKSNPKLKLIIIFFKLEKSVYNKHPTLGTLDISYRDKFKRLFYYLNKKNVHYIIWYMNEV